VTARVERWGVTKRVVEAPALVTSQHWRASEAGAAVLRAGGNAVDAAVTTAFTLGVVEPWMSGLAACGFMLVAKPGRPVEVIDFAGVTPARIEPGDYPIDAGAPPSFLGLPSVQGGRNHTGWAAACVPGAVAGLAAALERHGTIGLDRALAAAIAIAEEGLPVDWHTTLTVALAAADLVRDPTAAAIYLPGGHPPQPGTRLPMPALAATLRTLAVDGPGSFYEGPIGERLVADLRAGGSRIDLVDLAAYRALVETAPSAPFRDHVVHVAGPTSGGERLLDAFAQLAATPPPFPGPPGPSTYLTHATALDAAFAAYKRRNQPITAEGSTSHVNAVDADGTMVALTFTLLTRFGARVVSPATGILLNNGMAWFDPRPGRPRSVAPTKRAQSNKCPAIATRDGTPVIAVGASGANQIVPAVFQVLAYLIDHRLDVGAALRQPRIDAADRGKVTVDVDLDPAACAALAARFPLDEAQRLVFPKLFAAPAAITRDPRTGIGRGMADLVSPVADVAGIA
jgi:gamma-glutamyltranspeptidase/glutathione hydrolase